MRNPSYHVGSFNPQDSTTHAYAKTRYRLYKVMSSIHSIVSIAEDAELDSTLCTRSTRPLDPFLLI